MSSGHHGNVLYNFIDEKLKEFSSGANREDKKKEPQSPASSNF